MNVGLYQGAVEKNETLLQLEKQKKRQALMLKYLELLP